MKKLLTCILFATLVLSCSNDNELFNEKNQTEPDLTTENIVPDYVINTEEDWLKLFSSNGEFSTNKTDETDRITTRAWIDSRFVKGYMSNSIRYGMGNVNVYYGSEISQITGLSAGVYTVDFHEPKFTLYLGPGERLWPTNSPNCGFQPDAGNVRGYATSEVGNTVICTTYITHIKRDVSSGRTLDIWYPCRPQDLVWNYDIYIP